MELAFVMVDEEASKLRKTATSLRAEPL